MKVYNLSDMKGGWFVGDFTPTAYRSNFEVAYTHHKKGEKWDIHYHKAADEVTLLVEGRMRIQDKIISPGEIFVIPRYEIADPEFLEDCKVVIVKSVSNTSDKFPLQKKENKASHSKESS